MLQVKFSDLIQRVSAWRRTVAAQPQTAAVPHGTETSSGCTRGRLLLAEFEEIDQLIGIEMLQPAGWTVDVVDDGLEAVRAVQKSRYDAVVLGCRLAELDGPQAATEIRRLENSGKLPAQGGRALPIVGLTANLQERDRCLAAGMNGHVTRPVVARELLAALDRLLAAVPPREAQMDSQRVEELLTSVESHCEAVQDALQFTEDNTETDEFPPPPPPRRPVFEETAIDLDSLRTRCFGSDAMVEKLLGKFRGQLATAVASIAKAVESGNRRLVIREAHSLKGYAANVSADRLSHVAGELEHWARRDSSTSPARLLAAVKSAAHECEEYLARQPEQAVAVP